VNNFTYGDIGGLAVPHGVGFVWATMLWDMTWALVDEHGFNPDIYDPWNTGGTNLANQLVVDGLLLQPCNPGFVDGRDGILAADQALTGGANQCIIWEAFAARGLGFSASQGSSTSTTDGTEAFDLPNACLTLDVTPLSQNICQGQTATYTVSVGTAFTTPVDMSASGNPAPTTAVFTPDPVPSVPSTTDLTIGNTGTAPVGTHTITILADDGTITDTADVDLGIYAGAPGSAPALVLPVNGATGVGTSPSLTWNAVSGATNYYVEIADDAGFTNIVYTADEPTTTHLVAASLAPDTTHYWRVTAENPCGSSAASAPFSFTTVNVICRQPALVIADNATVTDAATIATNGTLLDMNVSINADHTWVGDTIFALTHNDTGTTVTMIDRPGRTTTGFGCSGDDIDAQLDDEGLDGPVENQCSNAPALFGSPTPNFPLTAFDGEDLSGTWTLSVSDAAGGDTGVVNEWCIIPVTEAVGYSIELEKTVGTDPNTCAASDSLTLPPGGGDVTYCYTVTNTGLVTLTLHTLVDDQLGTILNSFPYNLNPGASAFVTATTTITNNVVNVATWTAGDGSDTASATDSASVTVQYYLPDIETDPSVTSAQPADTVVTQTLQITNAGEVTGTAPFIGGGSDLVWNIQEEAGSAPHTPALPMLGGLAASSTSGNAAETVADAASDGSAPAAPATVVPYRPQGNVLYDNGPLVNSPGTGPGGSDESLLQDTSLAMTIFGFGHQIVNNNSVADDFTVPAGEQWTVDTLTFYAYQTGSTTTSTITGVNATIWDGDPSSGTANVVVTSTNLIDSQWSNIYRGLESAPGNTQRPIMANVVDFGGLVLTEGTYWVEWQTAGSLASGPWAPPITINGQTTTGNALQNLAGTWGAAIDVGPQGFPFLVSGSSGCSSDIPWLSVSPDNGTTALFDTSDVNVVFDSTGLATGTYTGTLCVSSNDLDEPLVTVPVTLSVVVPVYGVTLSGDDAASGNAGTTVTYTLDITNTSNVVETFDLGATGVWTATLSDASVTLNPGESTSFTVWVEIPADATDQETDVTTVTATSQSDNTVTDVADLTTTAVVPPPPGFDIYLPVVMKP
jgi:subtilisin-like proprotein convertase family protein